MGRHSMDYQSDSSRSPLSIGDPEVNLGSADIPEASIAPPGGPESPNGPSVPGGPVDPMPEPGPEPGPGTDPGTEPGTEPSYPEPGPNSPEITPSEPPPYAPDDPGDGSVPLPTWHTAGHTAGEQVL